MQPLSGTFSYFVLYLLCINHFPDSILYSSRAREYFLLYSPPMHMGIPQKIALGLGREATTSFQGPGMAIVLLATPVGLPWIESREGIVVHTIATKENFVLVYSEVLILKLKHRRSTKECPIWKELSFSPVFRLKAITMKQTERKPSKEYCEWL